MTTTYPFFIRADRFVTEWAEALGVDPMECQRIVIDAEVGGLIRIFVEKVGTNRLLKIKPPSAALVELTIDGVPVGGRPDADGLVNDRQEFVTE